MLRSRMFTTAFRFFAALAAAALAGAFIGAVGSNPEDGWVDRVVGPISVGWMGGVGNHLGYTVMLSLAVVAALLGGIHVAFRDADPEAEAEVVRTDSVPLTRAPTGTNFLPIVAAFGVAILIVGQITEVAVTLAGFGILAAVVAVWTLRAWAERATGDERTNSELYERFVEPLRVPLLSLIVVAVVAIALSRLFLAVTATGAVVLFTVIGSAFLFGAALLAARPAISKNAVTIALFIGALALVGAGIAAAVVGERDFEHHGEEDHGAETGGVTEDGLAPFVIELPAEAEGDG
jgi:hypothetical protein